MSPKKQDLNRREGHVLGSYDAHSDLSCHKLEGSPCVQLLEVDIDIFQQIIPASKLSSLLVQNRECLTVGSDNPDCRRWTTWDPPASSGMALVELSKGSISACCWFAGAASGRVPQEGILWTCMDDGAMSAGPRATPVLITLPSNAVITRQMLLKHSTISRVASNR